MAKKAAGPIQNLRANLNRSQKIALFIVLLIMILLVIFIPTVINSNWFKFSSTTKDRPYTDEEGNIYSVETRTDENGNKYTVTTREDIYGNITTTDPNLITTYFPYQVMREHEHYTPTLRYYLSIDQTSEIIQVIMEDCDIVNDKELINQYIESIPFDLSNYTINYEMSNVDTSCEP